MRSVAIAIVLAACSPEPADFDYPTAPVSNVVGTSGGTMGGTGGTGGGDGDGSFDAGGAGDGGTLDGGSGTPGDAGLVGDAGGPRLDAAPPDAAASLDGGTDQIPENPDQIP